MLDRRSFFSIALGTSALCLTGCTNKQSGSRQLGSATTSKRALIYRGPASSPGCSEAAAAILSAPPLSMHVEYVGPGGTGGITARVLETAVLYVQPGGGDDLDAAWRSVAPFASVLQAWIDAGGAYVGCCMGGFLAGSQPGFNLLPGDSEEYIATRGATVHNNDDALVTVNWRGKPQAIYFQGGPAFAVRPSAEETVLARYSNGAVAAGVFQYGNGAVGVTGPHPEAPLSWYTDAGLTAPTPLPHARFVDLVRTTLARTYQR